MNAANVVRGRPEHPSLPESSQARTHHAAELQNDDPDPLRGSKVSSQSCQLDEAAHEMLVHARPVESSPPTCPSDFLVAYLSLHLRTPKLIAQDRKSAGDCRAMEG